MDKIGAAVWATGRAGWVDRRRRADPAVARVPERDRLQPGQGGPRSRRGMRARGPASARPSRPTSTRSWPDPTSTSCSTRASGRRPRSQPRACARTGPARTRSRSPGSSIRAPSWAPTRPPELDAGVARGGSAHPRHRVLGLPDDHPAAGLDLERARPSTRSGSSGSPTRRCGATASCATRASAARSRRPATAS